jgi:hypothetical protein
MTIFERWWKFWYGSDGREVAILHDAKFLREKFGTDAEAYCDDAIASPALSRTRYEEIAAIRRVLPSIPPMANVHQATQA